MFAKKLKKLENPQVGSKCVVREGVDTPIYTIKAMGNGNASLDYTTDEGRRVSGGVMPLDTLYEPTKEQLGHDALTKRIYK